MAVSGGQVRSPLWTSFWMRTPRNPEFPGEGSLGGGRLPVYEPSAPVKSNMKSALLGVWEEDVL